MEIYSMLENVVLVKTCAFHKYRYQFTNMVYLHTTFGNFMNIHHHGNQITVLCVFSAKFEKIVKQIPNL